MFSIRNMTICLTELSLLNDYNGISFRKRPEKLIYSFPPLKQPYGNFCILPKKILINSFNEISFQEHFIKGYYHFSLSSTLQQIYPLKEGEGKQNFGLISHIFFPLLCLGQLQGTFTCSMLQPGTGYVAIRAKLPLF